MAMKVALKAWTHFWQLNIQAKSIISVVLKVGLPEMRQGTALQRNWREYCQQKVSS
jgi:hypothetical protein